MISCGQMWVDNCAINSLVLVYWTRNTVSYTENHCENIDPSVLLNTHPHTNALTVFFIFQGNSCIFNPKIAAFPLNTTFSRKLLRAFVCCSISVLECYRIYKYLFENAG